MNVSDTIFQRLRKDYGKIKYDDILNVITSGKSGEKFEMLFMMHMLGIFLASTSSTTPDDKLLKVLTSTMKGFAHFDWATYIAKDLRKELSDYVNVIRGKKRLQLLCWRVHIHVIDSHKRLVAAMEDELRKAQDHIERQRKQQVDEAEDDGDDNGKDANGDNEGQEGDGDGLDDGEASYEDDATGGTPINIVEYHGQSPTVEGGTNDGEQSIVPYPVQQQDAPQRSQRPKKPKNMSP
ncbi:hypothetical protein K1719_027514 [Acacia pycnantha]|nr:hypothetical protein K1719_027514 [Acacia pycnantha]